MDSEIQAIVAEINNIKGPNYLKDYFFPLLIVFIGGFFAHFSTSYMRYLDAQKQKLDIANDWILGLIEALDSLINIKNYYNKKLTDNPLQRVGVLPEIVMSSRPLDLPINKLSFIVQSKDEFLADQNDLMNPSYISALQTNYNLLLSTLHQRNKIADQIIPVLGEYFSKGGVVVEASLPQIYSVVNKADFLRYVQLTEHIIKTTDELLIATHNFLCDFPDICRYTIDTERIKHYGKVIDSYYDHMHLLEITTPVNMQRLAELFGVEEHRIRERFVSGYENQPEAIEKTTEMLRNPSVCQNIEKYKRDQLIKKRHRKWWA